MLAREVWPAVAPPVMIERRTWESDVALVLAFGLVLLISVSLSGVPRERQIVDPDR